MRDDQPFRRICPKCGAPPGFQCVGSRGQERASIHRARMATRRPWGNPQIAHHQDDIIAEAQADASLQSIVVALAEVVRPIWHWGDGEGGYVKLVIEEALAPLSRPGVALPQKYRKAHIGRQLRTQVLERDAYRCVSCGGYERLTCDHIIPESRGGPTTLDNLQAMCAPCNSKKGARV